MSGDGRRPPGNGNGNGNGNEPGGGSGTVRPQPIGEVDVTVVIPAYNTGPRLGPNVQEAAHVLGGTGRSFELVVVDDGSTDGSAAAVRAMAAKDDRIRLIELGTNHGKGFAVRAGLVAGHGRWRGFIDADGDLPFTLLERFIDTAMEGDNDIVFGTKHGAALSDVSIVRRISSRAYALFVRALFALDAPDTQTGIKLMSRAVVDAVVPNLVEERFAFDVELLVEARARGYTRWAALPVRPAARLSTTISPARVLQLVSDTLAVRRRHRNRAVSHQATVRAHP